MTDQSRTIVLSDDQWAVLGPLIDECRPRGKTEPVALRETIEAIVWRHQNGAKWRSVPPDLVPWWRAAQTFIRWSHMGVWERLLERVQERGVELGMAFLDGTSIRAHHKAAGASKKLGRQSQLLEGALFEGGEVGGRVPAEAGAQDPGVVALFQAGSGFAPFDRIDRRQVLGADWSEAGQRRGEDADGAAHDQAWRGDFAAGGAPLMVALSAEELLQVVVGRRQAGNLQVMEQAGAVAVGDLEEAVNGIAQGAAGIPAVAPSVEQAGVAGLDVIGRAS